MVTVVVLLTVQANDGTKIAKYRETVNMAIEITFNVSFVGLHATNVLTASSKCVAMQFTRQGLES